MAKIGIGITTRNRDQVFHLCLMQFEKHGPKDAEYVVMDDNSVPSMENLVMQSKLPISYLYSKSQIGVAHGKNECLRRLRHCDYIFLFDDDCFPIHDGWADFYINEHLRTGQHHFIYNLHGALRVMKIHRTVNNIETYLTGTGCFMFLTKAVVEKIGGFNVEYGLWGHEHNGYSRRIFNAKLNSLGIFMSPVNSEKYLYSLDLQRVPQWAKGVIKKKFRSAESEWWKKIQARELRTLDAYKKDCSINYYQEL